jgi:putative protease
VSPTRNIPELLSPAGSLDAVRAAVANGADAIYLGAEKFNARDEGAQLTLDDLTAACALAHSRGVRIYLTLNTLVKPGELHEALAFLGEAIDRGIDAAIVQDIGLISLIHSVYPGFEIHGSTQMTVHDESGARLMHDLGIDRVVLARENTIEDIRAIHAAVPELGLETFIHGALCISYSGQCYMSGMISERSANRGSCAQSCRKDYTLTDAATGETLDSGFLISAKDLGAYDSLADIADAGVGCLKIEGRKKRPEYVATVTRSYRDFLTRVGEGDRTPPATEEVQDLVQIFSRGFTPGMYRGRAGKEYVTREHPDNRGVVLGTVSDVTAREVIVEVSSRIEVGDGIAFEGDNGTETIGASVTSMRILREADGNMRQALTLRARPTVGATVVRSSDAVLLARARDSFSNVELQPARKRPVDVAAFGSAGAPLKLVFRSAAGELIVRSDVALAPASKRALDVAQIREQLGRLGETSFALRDVDANGLAAGLFMPVSALNHMRQSAIAELEQRVEWNHESRLGDRAGRIAAAIADVSVKDADTDVAPTLSAHVYDMADARAAAAAGATEIVLDPFLRHPTPPVSRVRALATELADAGIMLRIRTPSVVRPEDRKVVDKWLALDLPVVSGHTGLVVELASAGRDVVADYAVNCFNQHTAARLIASGVRRVVPSIELTTEELGALVAPWNGRGFDVMIYGRPEGMTIEHCVLSAAFDRVPTTCRDLCVQKHANVSLTDPAGYTFAVATDSACRNRLLHSRPVEGSEYIPRLWSMGIRSFNAVFNVPGDAVADIIGGYRAMMDSLMLGRSVSHGSVRSIVGTTFTRGHFARAV